MVDFVHIAVDFDRTNLGLLHIERQQQLVVEARQLAGDLRRKEVPTIWVSFPKGYGAFDMLDAPVTWPARNPRQRPKNQLSLAGLESIDIKTDEDIFLKGAPDSFYKGFLGAFIREKYGAQNFIVSGGTTTVCVPATLGGGVGEGFCAFAVYDRCYTTLAWDRDPTAHKLFLDKWARETVGGGGINLLSASELLLSLPERRLTRAVSNTYTVPTLT